MTFFLIKIQLSVPVYSYNVLEFSSNNFSRLKIKWLFGYVFFDYFPSLIDEFIAFEQFNDTQRVADLLLLGFQNAIALFEHTYKQLLESFLNPSLIHSSSLAVLYYLVHSIDQPLFTLLGWISFLYLFGLAFPLPKEHLLHNPFLKVRDSCLASLIRRRFFLEFSIMIRKIFRSLDLSCQVIIFRILRHEFIKFCDRKDLAEKSGVSILADFWRDESIVIMEDVLGNDVPISIWVVVDCSQEAQILTRGQRDHWCTIESERKRFLVLVLMQVDGVSKKEQILFKIKPFQTRNRENFPHIFSGLSSKDIYSSRSMRFCLPLQSGALTVFNYSCNFANFSVSDLNSDFWTLISASLRQTASLIACCFFLSIRLNQISFRFNISSILQTFLFIVLTSSSNLVSRSYSESASSPLTLSNSPTRYSSLCDCIWAICFCIDYFNSLELTRSCYNSKFAFLNLSVNSLLSTPAFLIFSSCSFFLFIWVNWSSSSICCFSNRRASFYDNYTYSQSIRV